MTTWRTTLAWIEPEMLNRQSPEIQKGLEEFKNTMEDFDVSTTVLEVAEELMNEIIGEVPGLSELLNSAEMQDPDVHDLFYDTLCEEIAKQILGPNFTVTYTGPVA